jgi:hypothetical protein
VKLAGSASGSSVSSLSSSCGNDSSHELNHSSKYRLSRLTWRAAAQNLSCLFHAKCPAGMTGGLACHSLLAAA